MSSGIIETEIYFENKRGKAIGRKARLKRRLELDEKIFVSVNAKVTYKSSDNPDVSSVTNIALEVTVDLDIDRFVMSPTNRLNSDSRAISKLELILQTKLD